MQGAGCRVQGAGCRVQGAGCRVQGTCTLLLTADGVLGTRRHLTRGGGQAARKADMRLPGKWNSNSHGPRPVHQNKVDSDQKVVNEELSLWAGSGI